MESAKLTNVFFLSGPSSPDMKQAEEVTPLFKLSRRD